MKFKNLKVNMYIRNDGEIGKIISITQTEQGKKENMYDVDYENNGLYSNGNNDTKASFNIIDLIEVGDLVNGYEVMQINDVYYLVTSRGIKILNEIKSITTHEQIKANQYEVSQ